MKAAAVDYLNNQTTDTSAYDLVYGVVVTIPLLYNYLYSIKLTVTTMFIIILLGSSANISVVG